MVECEHDYGAESGDHKPGKERLSARSQTIDNTWLLYPTAPPHETVESARLNRNSDLAHDPPSAYRDAAIVWREIPEPKTTASTIVA